MVDDLKVLEHFSLSDHNMVEFNFMLKSKSCDKLIYNYNFRRGNYEQINNNLHEVHWLELFDLTTRPLTPVVYVVFSLYRV